MKRTTFLEHYRICVEHDGAPQELSRTGTVITYKAVDDRFGESVALKLVPIASIDPATQERVEAEASAAQKLITSTSPRLLISDAKTEIWSMSRSTSRVRRSIRGSTSTVRCRLTPFCALPCK